MGVSPDVWHAATVPTSATVSNHKMNENVSDGNSTGIKDKKLLLGKYAVAGLLGRGSFATVYEAQHVATGQAVAIKCMSKKDLKERGLTGSVEREVAALRRLHHPNVVRIHEVLACRRRAYIVMELARGGELFSRMARDGRFPETKARVLFRQLVSAVGYCHEQGVFHRDLKPQNLLLHLGGDDADSEEPCLKITDFGLSAVAGMPTTDCDVGDATGQKMLQTQCGTPAYVAPEILSSKGKPYDGSKADVWSCGVILYAMTAGYLPFNDLNLTTMCRKICCGRFWLPPSASRGLRRLLARLLDTDPSTRMTVEEIHDDAWFNSGVRPQERAELRRLTRYGDVEDKYSSTGCGKHETGAVDQDLNAFDIISFSSGLDLSGMLVPVHRAATARFVMAWPLEAVAKTVQRTAEEANLKAGRREGKGVGLVVRRKGGDAVVARVEVMRVGSDSDVVVVEVGPGPDGVFEGSSYKLFWKEKLGPALARLAIASRNPQ